MDQEALKRSNPFLNIVLNHIATAIFVVDESYRIHKLNDTCGTLFSKTENEKFRRFCEGFVACRHLADGKLECGKLPFCADCALGACLNRCFQNPSAVFKEKLTRKFEMESGAVSKHFQLVGKRMDYQGKKLVLILLEDVTELEEQRKQLDMDLAAAAQIQRNLLPSEIPRGETVDVAWKFTPCGKVGGDAFNVMQLDEHHWGMYVLDVSGHGLASAMVAVSVAHVLQPQTGYLVRKSEKSSYNAYLMRKVLSYHTEIVPPSQVLKTLDEEYDMQRYDNFFSISYLVLDTRDGTLRYSNAGHPFPVVLHADGTMELLKKGGPVIGLGVSADFQEEVKRLRPGDKLFLYTDGLDEYADSRGDLYGAKRFYQVLRQWSRKPVARIVDAVMESIAEFGGDTSPGDDVSLLGLAFKGEKKKLNRPL